MMIYFGVNRIGQNLNFRVNYSNGTIPSVTKDVPKGRQ